MVFVNCLRITDHVQNLVECLGVVEAFLAQLLEVEVVTQVYLPRRSVRVRVRLRARVRLRLRARVEAEDVAHVLT